MANINTPLRTLQEVLNASYDTVANKLCVSIANSNPPANLLSVQEILNRVFDSTNNRLNTQ